MTKKNSLKRELANIVSRRVDFCSKFHLQSDVRPTFTKIIEIAEIPTMHPTSKIDVNELIRLRESDEARAFRDWLQGSQNLSDKEAKELLFSWTKILGETLKTKNAKVLRWLTSTGVGSIEPVTGTIFSALDFFLDKFLPGMGPIGFITGEYKKFIKGQSK